MTNKNNVKAPSLKKRLIITFLILSLIIIALLWLFQTVFLKDVYRSLKVVSTERCTEKIQEALVTGLSGDDSEEAVSEINALSRKYAACIRLFKINEHGAIYLDRHVNALCFVHNLLDSTSLSSIYEETVQNGGKLRKWISLSSMFGLNDEKSSEYLNVIMSRVFTNGNDEYMLLVNCELEPLNATVETLSAILIFVTVIFIIIAVIMAVISANTISKPIKSMSDEAAKLASGNYDVNFEGGYTEETVQLSTALNNAALQLSKLDRMQKDLIANVSHDLRTPLTMIQGYSEVMRDIPGEATTENLQIIIDETKRLSDLVSDMMEFSKNQSGTETLKTSRFNFTESIRKTLERYSKLKEKDGYNIIFETDGDVYVNADEGKILQVLYNLINNAVNYTGDDKKVTVTEKTDNGRVTLKVTDTGEGISEENLPLVWERYYKVHDFHKRENMGTGLGLSIVKNILIMHGAEYGVESTPGNGSTFWFTLPTVK